MTEFNEMHPGGDGLLAPHAGTDCTEVFYGLHRHSVLSKYAKYQIGVVAGAKSEIAETNAPDRISVVPFAETPNWQEGSCCRTPFLVALIVFTVSK